MATWKIPTIAAETAPYEFQIALDGSIFTIDLAWNERAGRWFYGIATAEGVSVVSSQPVLNRHPLLRWVDDRLPPGKMLAVAMSEPNREASVAELGSRVMVVYIDAAVPA